MKIKSLTSTEFDNFSLNHPYSSYYQTSKYALLMGEHGYDFEYIGLIDEKNNIVAASLILLKRIKGKILYGYAPNGFLIDYDNYEILEEFTNKIKDYFYYKNVAFIKLNPPVAIGKIDLKNYTTNYNKNLDLKEKLNNLKYLKLKNNMYFESSLPRFNGIVSLKKVSEKDFAKNTRNKINKSIRRGLIIEEIDEKHFSKYLKNIPKDKYRDDYFLEDLYKIFNKDSSVTCILVKIDYEEYLINARIAYDKELTKNTLLNEKLINNPNESNIDNKMNSDLIVLSYKNDILEGTKGLNEKKDIYIGGAIIVKYKNTISIVHNWYDKKYSKFNANYFLHYSIIKNYQNEYDYLDLNGMTGDFTKSNAYYGLNKFKMGFKPNVYEYIGEYDLIINYDQYVFLQRNNYLAQEFNKKDV